MRMCYSRYDFMRKGFYTVVIFLQILGTLGGIAGIVGIFMDIPALLIAGAVVCFLLCHEHGSMVEMIIVRIFLLPLLSVIGMLICHFALHMGWGQGFLDSFVWVGTVVSAINLAIAIGDS